MELEGISKELWPIHVHPCRDELLSSWVVRLAHAHGYRVETACLQIFGRNHDLWNRDSDKSISLQKITRLARVSGFPETILEGLTLRTWSGMLCENVVVSTSSPGILPAGVYHRKRRHRGLMFCTECLNHDQTPYFRRLWRLAYLTACPEHGTVLLDHCLACGAFVVPHRVDMKWAMRTSNGASLQVLCWNCGGDLRQNVADPASWSEVRFARRIVEALAEGHIYLTPQVPLHSISFFNGIRTLAGCVRLARIRGNLSGYRARDSDLQFRWSGLEWLPLEQRRDLLLETSYLLEAWPTRFLAFAKKNRITYTDIAPQRRVLPYWLAMQARWELLRKQGTLS